MIFHITSVDQFGHQIRQFRCCHHISYENTFSFQDFEFKVADPGLEPALLVMEGTTHCVGGVISFLIITVSPREKRLCMQGNKVRGFPAG